MQRNLSASWIFPASSAPIVNGVVTVDVSTGEIVDISTEQEAEAKNLQGIEKFEGALVPGFVNAHCHLELSHLQQQIPEKTGLPAFVSAIVSKRDAPDELVLAKMKLADQQMFESGIVAVGDISNKAISKQIKIESALYYHTFLEVFGFNEAPEPIVQQALNIRDSFGDLTCSIVPHAPYSVAPDLFAEIKKYTSFKDILSIHNQETAAETEFFVDGTGSFEAMYERMGIPVGLYHGSGHNSLRYHLPQLPQNNLILVHNTFTTAEDIAFAEKHHGFIYWCFCPNANQYIEGTLPNVPLFEQSGVKIVLGTDSLASNHQLSILAEMQTLQEAYQIPFENLISWATINGAKALNISSKYGSFQRGKKPGVNLIRFNEMGKINSTTTLQRIV